MTHTALRGLGASICLIGLVGTGLSSVESRQAPLPEKLAAITPLITVTPQELNALNAQQPVSRVLDADPNREVAVLGVVWIDAPASEYVARLKDIERFERGSGFLVTKRISDPPRLDDFAKLDLPDDEIADLRKCRVGDCDLQLSQSAIDRMRREIDWRNATAAGEVKALARRMALEFVTAYQRAGNAELAVYRDDARPTFVAQEFAQLIEQMPVMLQYEPALRQYLLDYPTAQVANATSFFYWQQVQFGLKPTIRINHVVIVEKPSHVVVASKQLYSSHYFWTALELRVLIPDAARGRGFWLITLNRARSNGLSGFVGRLIRGRVRSEALKGLTESLKASKSALERRGG